MFYICNIDKSKDESSGRSVFSRRLRCTCLSLTWEYKQFENQHKAGEFISGLVWKEQVPLLSGKFVDQENPIFSYENGLVILYYNFENGWLCHSRKIPYFPYSFSYSFVTLSVYVLCTTQENPIFSYVLSCLFVSRFVTDCYVIPGKSHIFLCVVVGFLSLISK